MPTIFDWLNYGRPRQQQPGRGLLNSDPGGLLSGNPGTGGAGGQTQGGGYNTGLDPGVSPMGMAGVAGDIAGRVGSALGSSVGMIGGPIGGALGSAAVTGMTAGMATNGLNAIGAPGINIGSALASSVTGGMLGQSVAQQAAANMASMNPTMGPAMPAEIAMAQLNAAIIGSTDFDGNTGASPGAGLNGSAAPADIGGWSAAPTSYGDSTGGDVAGSPGDPAGNSSAGAPGDGPGEAGQGGNYRRGGYTGDGDDNVVQPGREAGRVHEGEVVIPAAMVQRYGLAGLLGLVDGSAPAGLLSPSRGSPDMIGTGPRGLLGVPGIGSLGLAGMLGARPSDPHAGYYAPDDPNMPREMRVARLGR